MLLLNIEYIPGKRIEALGMVKGSVVQCKNFGKDFMAGMKTEADAVIAIRYASASIMQSAAEICAYGTAVRVTGDA